MPAIEPTPLGDAIRGLRAAAARTQTRVYAGRVQTVIGSVVKADLPAAAVGELCELRDSDTGKVSFAEVVGVDGATAILAPHGATDGLSIRTQVIGLGRKPGIFVGPHLLGAVIDAFGRSIEAGADSDAGPPPDAVWRPIFAPAPSPLSRPLIRRPLVTGVRAIDALMTCGEGQRVGVFGSAGVGKSSLISQIVAEADADVMVVALVGERGREVGDFLTRSLTPQARRRSVLVVATSDRPPLERMQASLAATTVAEHFRDQGRRVLLIVDSVTRLARALRDIALAAGEPPARRGFPPSVFSALPLLFERAGPAETGSITAFYTVLVEGDPMADPIVEETKSLLDGHIMLSEKIAAEGRYPAIDVLESKSRLMGHVVNEAHEMAARRVRAMIARYREVELLIQVGEYKTGADPAIDEAIAKNEAIKSFLAQRASEPASAAATLAALQTLAA